jgi:hypothetical protein
MFFAFKLFMIFITIYRASVKCLIFTLIINLYLFFGQSTDGKELTIAKDIISNAN